MKKLGIIGGMGPAATMYFASRVVDLTQAQSDQEHLDITILNRPWVPDRSAFLDGDAEVAPFCPPIKEMAIQLEHMGCGVLCMPCNTAHACFSQIEDVLLRAKMVSMPDSVARVIAEEGFGRVGILATSGTRSAQVYEKALAGTDVSLIWSENNLQAELMKIIYQGIKQGVNNEPICLDKFFQAFLHHGCEAVIVGCTELSLLLARDTFSCSQCIFNSDTGFPLPIIDALDVLALRCIQACGATARDTALNHRCAASCQSILVNQSMAEHQGEMDTNKEVCLCAG